MLITYGENGSDVGAAVVSPCGHGPLSLLHIEVLLADYDHYIKVASLSLRNKWHCALNYEFPSAFKSWRKIEEKKNQVSKLRFLWHYSLL